MFGGRDPMGAGLQGLCVYYEEKSESAHTEVGKVYEN